MTGAKTDVLMLGPMPPLVVNQLSEKFTLHRFWEARDRDALVAALAPPLRAMAAAGGAHDALDGSLMAKFPQLEIVASLGVGYDHIDATWAGEHGIVVTNTPDVLTEEVADVALGLLLCTVRQLPQAERYLRAGKWPQGDFPLSPTTLRGRTVGIVGFGRIGKAIARRLDGFGVPVVYHRRHADRESSYRYYADLVEMAHDVDILIVATPGGPDTRNLIDAKVLEALGANGILINMARGSVVDEPALIAALKAKKLASAGLDVFAEEPRVPRELIGMEQVVLLPHVGTASIHTRNAMGQLMVDNLLAWSTGNGPLTPVPETPWRPRR